MKHLLYIVLLFITFTSQAQNDRCFQAYNQQGEEVEVLCVGQQVEFQDCGDQVPDENEYYIFDYEKGTAIPTPASTIKTHTYTTPGSYRVLQIANYGGSTLTDTVSQVFEVREAPVPDFTISRCANRAVSVAIMDDNYDSYTIDFGDGQQSVSSLPNSTTQYSYNTQGDYTITVTGSYTGGTCAGINTSTVTTLPPAPQPFIHNLTVLEQAANGQLQLALQDLQPGYDYVVQQWNGSTFGTIDTIQDVTQASLSHSLQVNTTAGVQYLVKPIDACGTTFANSNSISSIALTGTSGNGLITLSWQSAPFTGTFEIIRNGTVLETLSSSTSTFTDTDVSCGQAYQYEVRGIAANGSVSVSALQEVQAFSTTAPAAPYLLTTFDLNNHVVISMELPQGEAAQQMNVERSITGGAFRFIGQTQQTEFTDEIVAPEQVCYRTTFLNACANTSSYSNISCPTFLKAQKQDNGSAVLLTWSAYEGFPGGVRQYTVELLDENNNILSSNSLNGTTFTDRSLSDERQQLRYRIMATAANGTTVTYSNIVVVEQDLQLHVPSGFTPNGDGLNDTFEIKGRLYNSYNLQVYNSLGYVIYSGTEADAGWDGTYEGKQLPAGAYVYKITARNSSGTTKSRTGTITLLR
ncbi:PKD domain-containing protein [Pontibacter diazotrophicus]|uniref:PKD domain-containing protein n=1 Tax=Pontibacter diazotrophicus TaxID=1400979 RepID=A0A3D8LGD9_9BACT|nr:gliding motility-associated C-terminal domain-containing protein [Pontibacter diazotrophicus]RDV16457.1 PKD domain-containing protein [Pontibacter diazotrophicus]